MTPQEHATLTAAYHLLGSLLNQAPVPTVVGASAQDRTLPIPGVATPAPARVLEIADDLDTEWGDPVVFKDPPRWKGESFAGRHFSECSPEFLDVLAGFLQWKGEQQDKNGEKDSKDRPRSFYSFKDAARARGWAQRIRAQGPAVRETARTSSASARANAAPRPLPHDHTRGDAFEGPDDVPF